MICDFLDSNFFQTCILILTAGITWWIYRSRKKKELQNAVTILLLQIEDIEKNIEFLDSEGLVGGVIQEKAVHYSAVIYDENNWTKYSHLIVGRISQLAFENIDKFFKVAQRIREQQLMIKDRLQQSMAYKGMYYYNGIYTRVNSMLDKQESDIRQNKELCQAEINFIKSLYSDSITDVPSFIQLELVFGLEKCLKQYSKLTDGVAYAELRKLHK